MNPELIQRVATANESQLIEITYQALIENIKEMKDFLIKSDFENMLKSNQKSREILAHILATIPEEGEETIKMRRVHFHVNRLMEDAYLKKDEKLLNDAILILAPICNAWKEIGEKEALEAIKQNQTPVIKAGMTYGKSSVNEYAINDNKKWDLG